MSTKRKIQKRTKSALVTKKLDVHESVRHIEAGFHRHVEYVDGKLSEIINVQNKVTAQVEEIKNLQHQIATFSASEFGKLAAQQKMLVDRLGGSVDTLDTNVLALAEVLKEVFGQLTQVDFILQSAELKVVEGEPTKLLTAVPDTAIEGIKDQAARWYQEVVASAFHKIREQAVADAQAREEAAAQAQQAAEQEARSRSEAETMENELRAAESAGIISQNAGGRGAAIPEGADVFGG